MQFDTNKCIFGGEGVGGIVYQLTEKCQFPNSY